MRDYADRIVAIAGAVLVLALLTYEVSALMGRRALVAKEVAETGKLAADVAGNEQPPPVRDASNYSGRVFAAWEDLPPSRDLDAWDFYPAPPRKGPDRGTPPE